MVDVIFREKDRFVPAKGFNVVGVDGEELPGSKLYLIGHYKTRGEADRALDRFKSDNPGETAHVYAPDTK